MLMNTQEDFQDKASSLTNLPALADDSPSRNPCKTRTGSQGRPSFIYNPYGFKVTVTPPKQPSPPRGQLPIHLPQLNTTAPFPLPEKRLMNADEEIQSIMSAMEKSSEAEPCAPLGLGNTPPPCVSLIHQLAPPVQPHNCAPRRLSSTRLTPLSQPIKKLRRHPVVVVSFKHSDGVFELPDYDPELERYDSGDYVVVEGDRGEHVGRISQCNMMHRHVTGQIGRIIRHATSDEEELVAGIRRQEETIKVNIQSLAEEMDVAMRVVDVEVQTDFNKLTIYYLSMVGGPVDFRQLQRRLFREFHCRIWFVNWDDC